MDDAQTWTLIAGFLALMVGMSGLLLRTVASEVSGLGDRFDSKFDRLDSKIDHSAAVLDAKIDHSVALLDAKIDQSVALLDTRIGSLHAEMNARFDTVDARFAAVGVRLDTLDRGVQTLNQHVIHERDAS